MPRRLAIVLGLAGALIVVIWLVPRGTPDAPTKPTEPHHARITWHDLAGMPLPSSDTAGPRCTTTTRAACFANTAEGAAFAAAHLLVRTFAFTGPGVFGPTIADQVIGAAQPAMAQQTSALYATAARETGTKNNRPIRTTGTWLAGYRTTSSIEVHVLIRQDTTGDPDSDGDPQFNDFTVNLTWQQNDWRLIAPPWGDWARAAHPVSNPAPEDWTPYDPATPAGAA